MSSFALPPTAGLDGTSTGLARPTRAAMAVSGRILIAIGVFLSGFVFSEPAPYELMLASLVAMFFLSGLKISRAVAPLLLFMLLFNIGGYLSVTQMLDISEAPLYFAVSTFLGLTAVFYAAILDRMPRIIPIIFRAWTFAALITATLGILGYFHAFPGSQVFTRYDRAMGAFQDPNVFGPYLVAPSLWMIHRLLTGGAAAAPLRLAALMWLAFGIFLSFSRAAWFLFGFASFVLVFFLLMQRRQTAFRIKVLALALLAVLSMVIALGVALQFPRVSELFSSRTQLVQSYDGGHLGRFERHQIGFQMMMERPFGIGPLVFGHMFTEDEHNMWLKSLTTYGWLGFVTYITMLITTLVAGYRNLLRIRPWQPFLLIAWATLLGHALIGNVIDLDHWRHMYMLYGLIWGCNALEIRHGWRFAEAQAQGLAPPTLRQLG